MLRWTLCLVYHTKPPYASRGPAHAFSPVSYDIARRMTLLHGRCRDGARVIRYRCRCSLPSETFRKQAKPRAPASRPRSIGPDRRRTLAYGSAYAPPHTYRENAYSCSVDEDSSPTAVADVAVALPGITAEKPQQETTAED